MKKFRRYARRAFKAISAERIARQRHRPIRSDTVFYESFAGNGMLCNPEAIFRYLLDHPDFQHFHHVWSLSDDAAIAAFQAEFAGHRRVSFVRRDSGKFWHALSTSGFVINNATFPPQFGKRQGQVYLNTWHGTPLKHMGFDLPDGAYHTTNTLRNFLMADYLLAANPFMSEHMYEGAYRLTNIYQGRLVEEGYPRVDRQLLDAAADAALRARLAAAGVHTADKRLVVYAPTWRGASFNNPDLNAAELATQVHTMQQQLGDDTLLLLKVHQAAHASAAGRPELAGVLVPNTIPTNVILGAAAGLITDYSSIFFDFLATARPIVFFTPDAADYAEDRGTYMSLDELPGPVSDDPATAGAALAALLAGAAPHPQARVWQERFTPYEDGNVTARVVDVVFRGARDGYRVRQTARDSRRRLLLHLGGMKSNGITSSALNLLSNIDYAHYDVTVVFPRVKGPLRANQRQIDPRARQIMRMGGMNGSKLLHLRRRIKDLAATPPLLPGDARWHSKLWRDEWDRVLGSAEFDWVADFSGYSPFWANFLLQSPDAPRAIWLHSEMASDRLRTAGRRTPMKRSLGRVFQLYRGFDRLVSVSPRLTAVNRANLAEFAAPGRFSTVRNFPSPAALPSPERQIRDLLHPGEAPPPWMLELEDSKHDTRWFITVGRLSPEKNHARLIRAFAAVHASNPEARLLIVGDGPLASELRQQIADAGLAGIAYLAGRRTLPTALLMAADCFVLSSNYEGQPMVLLEAALCDLPIVSTAFASVDDALPDDTIHVVASEDHALRDGMLAFLRGEVPPSHLDFDAYVAEVRSELQRVLLVTHLDTAELSAIPSSARNLAG